jgi:aminoglycoside phosphotransferase (APT) family kinase protein
MLTSGWLTRMLRSAGQLTEDQEVRSFSIQAIGHGVGMVGSTVRVELAYEGHGLTAPASLVMKFAHDVEARRAVGMKLRLYETEVMFYNRIAASVAVPKAACYFAAVDAQTGECLIVLEDMRRYRQGDNLAGVGLAEAKHVIDAITPLHAAYWENTGHEFLRDVMRVDSTWKERYMELVDGTWRNCLAQFGYCIPAAIEASLTAYIGGFQRLHRMMADRAQTLSHGDPRMDNLMFNDGEEGPPVVLLDWQTLMITNPLHDLAYLLSQSATIEARRAMEDELVRYYHAKVTELGVTNYSLEQCYDDYDLALLYMMSVAFVMGGAFDPANERGKRLAEETLRRACTSVVDRRLLERIPA